MNPIVLALATACLVFPNTSQIKADRAEIRLTPKRDTSIRYQVTKKVVESIELGDQTERLETTSESTVELALREEAKDGSLELGMKTGAIRGTFSSGEGSKPIPFDSEKPETTDAATKDRELARMLKSETLDGGIEVALKLARDAEVLEVKGYGDALKPKVEALYSDGRADEDEVKLARNHWSDGHLKKALINVIPRLPRNAIAVGDEFTLERGWHECPPQGACIEISLRCTVKAIDAETISIDVAGAMPAPEDLDVDKIEQYTLREFTVKGTLVFSRRDGFLKSLDIEQTADSLTPVSHGVLPVKKSVAIQYRRAS